MAKILTVMALILCLCACGSNDDTPLPRESATTLMTVDDSPLEEETSPYETQSTARSYAVMIDNRKSASRPHAGLEDASIVYEMYSESGSTQLMAIYKGTDTKKIGPVYSVKEQFVPYAYDNDAVLAFTGDFPDHSTQVDHLPFAEDDFVYFWSEIKDSPDVSYLYTSSANLSDLAEDTGLSPESHTLPFTFSSDAVIYEGISATDITIPYADFYYVSYKYDSQTGLYDRFINSEHHPTQSGAKLSAGQIIFQFAPSSFSDDTNTDMTVATYGSGTGIFISKGVQTPITWSRRGNSDKLTFYTQDGKELRLNPSLKTYVQVLPEDLEYTIK